MLFIIVISSFWIVILRQFSFVRKNFSKKKIIIIIIIIIIITIIIIIEMCVGLSSRL